MLDEILVQGIPVLRTSLRNKTGLFLYKKVDFFYKNFDYIKKCIKEYDFLKIYCLCMLLKIYTSGSTCKGVSSTLVFILKVVNLIRLSLIILSDDLS